MIVGGGNAAGYAARTFVEHDMANGRLCIVSKEVHLFIFSLCKIANLVCLVTNHYVLKYYISQNLELIGS